MSLLCNINSIILHPKKYTNFNIYICFLKNSKMKMSFQKLRLLMKKIFQIQIFLSILTFQLKLRSISETPTLTFSNELITATVSGEGYKISSTTLTINQSGTYKLTGSCSECNIEVKKSTTDVILILDSLTLSCSTTAPITLKKSTSVTIQLEGISTITDLENINNESTDENFEGAAIKIKGEGNLIIEGTGTLNANGSSCKNGIKGNEKSIIKINSGEIIINAANSGLVSDGAIIINDGVLNINSNNDGIKSEPDSTDTESEGSITINGGTININSKGDGIQVSNNLKITNGNIKITTLSGFNDKTFNSETMSCKGLKASKNENTNRIPSIIISGGTFNINTADDAIHSDDSITIIGGIFIIFSGDDGIHADTKVILGKENGSNDDLSITIKYSNEGIEGINVKIYSGTYNIYAMDDGINGKSDSKANSPNIYVYGGEMYINTESDGFDSNGDIFFYGGNIEVWGMNAHGLNEPIDHDGILEIKDTNIFAGGTRGIHAVHTHIKKKNQNYIYSTSIISSDTNIYVYDGNNNLVYQTKTPKKVDYLFYTSNKVNSDFYFANDEGRIRKNFVINIKLSFIFILIFIIF